MSEGGASAIEEALRIHPTWINGGGDLPGPGGSVIAAAMAVASGLCRHVLCFRTVWESTFGGARRQGCAGSAGGGGERAERVSGPFREWRAPFGAMSAANWIAMNADAVHAPLRRSPRDARVDRSQRAPQRRAEPERHLPRPHDDGRLPLGAADHLAVRALRLRRAVRRIHRRHRLRGVSRPTTSLTRRCASRRWAPRSSSGCRGTRTR